MEDPRQAVVFVLAIPLVTAFIVALIGRLSLRSRTGRWRLLREWSAPLALLASYGAAHIAIYGRPTLDPVKAENAVLLALAAACLIPWISAIPRVPRLLAGAFMAYGSVWLVMRWKLALGQWNAGELALWCAIASLAVLTLAIGAGSLVHTRRGADGAGQPDPVGLAALGALPFLASALILAQGGLMSGSQAAGALGIGVIGLSLSLPWRAGAVAIRDASTVVALGLGVITIDAVMRSSFSQGYAALICASPLAVVGARSLLANNAARWAREAVALVVGLMPLGAVSAIEVILMLTDESVQF